MIKLSDVGFRIGSKSILSCINLDLAEGKFICLVGANGSGKSSLLKLIVQSLKPDQGEIITPKPEDISYLPQALTDPPYLTIKEVIEIALKFTSKNKKNNDQKLTELSYEFKISHILDRQFSEISEGEKQRAWLAFCIAQRKAVAVMDEPLSSVDQNSREDYFKILKALPESGQRLLLVTHDVELALAYADRIITMENGKIVFDGKPNGFQGL